ncbi:MAG: hypothetical protein ABIT10_01500 [Alteraurantiacibacter sp.]
MTMRAGAFAAALLLASTAAVPAAAQDNAAVLAQIDASLPGTLINDPTSLDWRTSGARLKVSSVVDPAIPGGGAAVQYEVRRAAANPWEMQAYIPLTADIAEGEQVTFGFWARTLSSSGDGGLGQIRARVQRDADPYPGFGDTAFAVGQDWRWYEATTTATTAIPQRQAYVVLQLAAAVQVVEVGQALVVSGADRINGNNVRPPAELPPQLAGHGALISQPWQEEWVLQGPEGSHASRAEPAIWLGRATQFTSPAVGAQAWDIQASVPLTETLAVGEQIEIAIAARTVSAATDDGKARVGLRVQQASAPYDGFGEATFSVGPNWQLIRVRTTATADLAQGNGVVALHFAGAQQVVDVGPVYVVRLPVAAAAGQ